MLKNKIQNPKSKIQNKSKCQISNSKTKVLSFVICAYVLLSQLCLCICHLSYAQGEFTYDAKGKRDPFIPLVTPDGRLLKLEEQEGGVTGLLLEGIIYDKHGLSYAIVNGEVVRIGDKVGDYQVLKIEDKTVIFIKEGEPVELELKEEE